MAGVTKYYNEMALFEEWLAEKSFKGENKNFGGKRQLTDVDGISERWGQFIIIERKRVGTEIPQGQSILFENLLKLGKFTVLYVWRKHRKIEGEHYFFVKKVQIITANDRTPILDMDTEEYDRLIDTWNNLADRRVPIKSVTQFGYEPMAD